MRPITTLIYSNQINGDIAMLDRDESRHALRTLRLKEGDELQFTDGKGNFYEGRILETTRESCKLEILTVRKEKLHPGYIHIAVSLLKNKSRFEWFLEKAVETGVGEITPLLCHRSEAKKLNMPRARKILLAALKQSMRATLPVLNEPAKLRDVLARADSVRKFIASYSPENAHLADECKPGEDAVILIGPEGDFSEEEISLARDHGFFPINLSDSRLRTETAALAACMIANTVNRR